MLFDTHTHLNFPEFNEDRELILQKLSEDKIWITNVGTDFVSSKSAVELAEQTPLGVYATVGMHPSELGNFEEDQFANLITSKVVAVGECGLDYYHKETTPDHQKQLFSSQIAFAQKHTLPLVIHCRDIVGSTKAYEDVLDILKSSYTGIGIIHSFTDSWETAKKFLDLGFYVALNGIIFFDKSGNLEEVCKNLPSDRILTETDAPFLTPPPNRGKRNTPANVRLVAEKIAELRGEEFDVVCDQTYKNALSVFKINPSLSS